MLDGTVVRKEFISRFSPQLGLNWALLRAKRTKYFSTTLQSTARDYLYLSKKRLPLAVQATLSIVIFNEIILTYWISPIYVVIN